MPLVVQNVQHFADHPKHEMCRPSGNSQLLPGNHNVSGPAGKRDSSEAESSICCTIRGRNSTRSSLLNNSHLADITQHVTFTQSASQLSSIDSPTAMLGTSSHSTASPGGASQTALSSCVVSRPASCIGCTCTPLSSHEACLPLSRIPKPRWSLQIHCKSELDRGITGRATVNGKHRQFLHLDQWSQTVAALIDFFTQTWQVFYLQSANCCSSTCATDGRLWVQVTW
jgi:hypothetical protein